MESRDAILLQERERDVVVYQRNEKGSNVHNRRCCHGRRLKAKSRANERAKLFADFLRLRINNTPGMGAGHFLLHKFGQGLAGDKVLPFFYF